MNPPIPPRTITYKKSTMQFGNFAFWEKFDV